MRYEVEMSSQYLSSSISKLVEPRLLLRRGRRCAAFCMAKVDINQNDVHHGKTHTSRTTTMHRPITLTAPLRTKDERKDWIEWVDRYRLSRNGDILTRAER